MSCFFCNSLYHLSQNCDIYVSNECRKVFTKSKNCCEICLTPLNLIHYTRVLRNMPHQTAFVQGYVSECELKRKCYVCFSKAHHSVYCSERLKAPTLFLPNIDNVLIQRFIKILDEFDQLLLACTYPKIFNLIEPTTLKQFWCSPAEYMDHTECIPVIFFGFLGYRYSLSSLPPNFIKRTSIVDVAPTSYKISSNMFLSLLSHCTKIMRCRRVAFKAYVPFEEILKRTPNIEIIEFTNTNIEMGKTWPDDFIKYKSGNKFKKLSATIYDTDFNTESLATFMMEKCIKNVEIVLRLYIALEDFQNVYEKLSQKFLQCFDPFISKEDQIPHLSILLTEKHQLLLKNFKCLNFTLRRF